MSYMVFDEETTTQVEFKRKAGPFGGGNRKVALGWKIQGHEILGQYFKSPEDVQELVIPDEVTLLVGHNIKFDLLWEWANPSMQRFIKRGGKIWCTQYAEYLLEGQQQKYQMCAMNDIAEKYGGNTKVDAVKAMWDEGIETTDIPEDLLMRYLLGGPDPESQEFEHGDIGNTEAIFLGQVKRAKSAGQAKMIMSRMEGLLATTEMEFNGLCIDEERGEADRVVLAERLLKLDEELNSYVPDDLPFEFKWTSPIHKSALIFGGEVKYQKWLQHMDDHGNLQYAKKSEKWPLFRGKPVNPEDSRLTNAGTEEEPHYWYGKHSQDTFAGGKQKGKPKFKTVKVDDLDKPKGAQKDHWYLFPGFTQPSERWEGSRPGVYSVAADVIEALGNRNVPFLQALAERSKIDKDLGTYYWAEDSKGNRKGMLTLVDGGFIHHSLNHTSTVTGRLSSSNPNMQNIPRGDKSTAKAMFTSRFGDGGKTGEVDYSQLEVVGQGVLSQDEQLCADLRAKIDFHCKRLAYKLGEDYESVKAKAKDEGHPENKLYSAMRTGVKGFSFQRAYGAGAPAIADAIGMPVEEVEKLIEAEEAMYPGVKAFNDSVAEAVQESRWPCRNFVDNPYGPGVVQCGKGEWWSPTGTRYVFSEHPAPAFMQRRGTMASFSPPEMKNYPVQGLSGEIVQVILGKLFREYVKRGWWSGNPDAPALLTNTVHDCVWNDMRNEVVDEVLGVTVSIMQSVPAVFNAMYPDLEVDVPFPVEAEYGPNMLDLHHWEAA